MLTTTKGVKMQKHEGIETIKTYAGWCELMEIKACLIDSILEYKRVCDMMKVGAR